jgi:4-amino-4-deoxy-L-arabinose transferase-like glycosyltransferase
LTEREWREAGDLRPSTVGLLSIILLAAVLRFWALEHGIPYSLHPDEPEIVERAVTMMKRGTLHPNAFDNPTLYTYAQVGVACGRFIWGALTGEWASLDQAPPEVFYLWGRALTAALGVVTVLLVFQIGLGWGARHALLAAGLMAVLPLHVAQSHYVLRGVPVTLLVTLTMMLSLKAHERGTARAFLWAGVASGLAGATAYKGGLAVLMPLLACWMTVPAYPSRLVCALVVLGGGTAAYLIAAPYSFLDLPGFLNGFARLVNQYRTLPPPAEAQWLQYLKYLRLAFGWPAILLLIAGVVLALNRLIRGPGRVRWALVVAFPLVYFFFLSRQPVVFDGYLLPITPALSLIVATTVISGVSLLRRYEIPRAPRTALIVALTVAVLLPPTSQAIEYDRQIAHESTVDQAREWTLANIPAGSVIAIETRVLLLPSEKYRATNVPELIKDQATHTTREYADLAAAGFQYFIASSQEYGAALKEPHKYTSRYAAYMRLFEQSVELVRFTPSDAHPGPELRIYKIK